MPRINGKRSSSNGGGGAGSSSSNSTASSRNCSTPGSQTSIAENSASSATAGASRSATAGSAPAEKDRPTELILDFSVPGWDTRQPLTRRGHVKSRLGCVCCKRRRVKCDEVHPICGQCKRLRLTCAYLPDNRRPLSPKKEEDEDQRPLQKSVSPYTSAARQQPLSPSVGSAMNLDHLAFYHQFLTVAYPALPVKEKSAWADCAAMSHQYEYLAHAVLALGASHLTVNTSANWTVQALSHRQAALVLINERLGRPVETTAEGDALMGALICLCGQSSLMTDSVHEYFAYARGSYLLSQTVVIPMNGSIFRSITDSRHVDMLASLYEEQPKDDALIEEFQEYTASLTKICEHAHELQYQELLYRAVSLLSTAPIDAVRTFTASFVLPALFDNDSFSDFIREDNHTAHLLMANMFMLDYLLGQACFPKSETPKCSGRKDVLVAWVHKVVSRLPERYRDYGDFPLRFCRKLATYDSRYLFFP